jgi:hypothetical protein
MTKEQELPVVRKLLRKRLSYEHCYDGELVHANPDGPQAAELITELVEALESVVECSDRLCRENRWERNDAAQAVYLHLVAVLTKARASTGGDA